MTHAEGADRLLRTREVADMFGVDASTVNRWAAAGKIRPAVVTLGGESRYRRGDVLAAIEQAMHEDAEATRKDNTDPHLTTDLLGRPQ